MGERVVVTGMGIISPLGEGVEINWTNLTGLRVGPAPLPAGRGAAPPQRDGFQRARALSHAAASEALSDAGLWDGQSLQGVDPLRFGCTVSASKPLFTSSSRQVVGRDPSLFLSAIMGLHPEIAGDEGEGVVPPDAINDFIANRFGLEGERRNVIAACATGAYSMALAASWVDQGLCDIVLAGSVEPYPHPLIQAGFRQMGVLSVDGVTRPFDQRRSGFAFGEGAGVVVMESEKSANLRKARIYAQLSGWAMGADSHSAVAFNSNGQHIANVIARALIRGKLHSTEVLHVHAHGTATRLNDRIETQALRKAFGPHSERLMISATKAGTGHLLGASGSVEFILTVLALRHQFIPPTATLEEADPECGLDYTPRQGHPASFNHALSLSFGFGGPIGALAVSAC